MKKNRYLLSITLFLVIGVPPLVSRRVLETLTHLARNHPLVAKLLVELRLPQPSPMESPSSDRGKGVMVVDEEHKGQASLALLLSLLSQPLYLRSIAHLEQVIVYKQFLYFATKS